MGAAFVGVPTVTTDDGGVDTTVTEGENETRRGVDGVAGTPAATALEEAFGAWGCTITLLAAAFFLAAVLLGVINNGR